MSYNKWSTEEDVKLKDAIASLGEDSWKVVSEIVGTRDSCK